MNVATEIGLALQGGTVKEIMNVDALPTVLPILITAIDMDRGLLVAGIVRQNITVPATGIVLVRLSGIAREISSAEVAPLLPIIIAFTIGTGQTRRRTTVIVTATNSDATAMSSDAIARRDLVPLRLSTKLCIHIQDLLFIGQQAVGLLLSKSSEMRRCDTIRVRACS